MKQGQSKFGQVNFFKLCDWMQKNKAMLLEARYSHQELRDLVKEAIQLTPADSTLAEAKAAIGLEYLPKGKAVHGTRTGANNQKYIRLVAKCLRDLMMKLGEPVPEPLATFLNSNYVPGTPIPPPASTIPVVSKKSL